MVTLYADGHKVAWEDAEELLTESAARSRKFELRDETGKVLGRVIPEPAPSPGEPLIPWEPDITREEIERRMAEPGYTFEEVKKRLGWE